MKENSPAATRLEKESDPHNGSKFNTNLHSTIVAGGSRAQEEEENEKGFLSWTWINGEWSNFHRGTKCGGLSGYHLSLFFFVFSFIEHANSIT